MLRRLAVGIVSSVYAPVGDLRAIATPTPEMEQIDALGRKESTYLDTYTQLLLDINDRTRGTRMWHAMEMFLFRFPNVSGRSEGRGSTKLIELFGMGDVTKDQLEDLSKSISQRDHRIMAAAACDTIANTPKDPPDLKSLLARHYLIEYCPLIYMETRTLQNIAEIDDAVLSKKATDAMAEWERIEAEYLKGNLS